MTARAVKRSSRAARDRKDRALTKADKLAAFKACTGALPKHFRKEIAAGMTDAELTLLLERIMGIFGGASARPETPAIAYKGAGLKIWAGWDSADMTQKPIFAGAQTIALARQLYRISDPSDGQLQLF